MPRKAKPPEPPESLAPFLIGLDKLPEQPELAELVPSYKATGKIASKDGERVQRIIEMRLLGHGLKRIARSTNTGVHTIRAILRAAEREGILAPLKQRLSQKAGEVIEDTLDEIHDRVMDGTMPPNVLPVVAGVLADKKAGWDSGGGGPVVVRIEGLSVEALNQFFGQAGPATDSASVPKPPETPAIPHQSPAGSSLGAILSPSDHPAIEVEALPSAAPSPSPVEASLPWSSPAEEGGGGAKIAGRRSCPDGSPSGENLAKGSPASEPPTTQSHV